MIYVYKLTHHKGTSTTGSSSDSSFIFLLLQYWFREVGWNLSDFPFFAQEQKHYITDPILQNYGPKLRDF